MIEKPLAEISVVIPAYNERWRILGTLLEMVYYLEQNYSTYEIIVVDDGSTDGTTELVERLAELRAQIELIKLGSNQGKGKAVRTGMLAARGKMILFTDADGAASAVELPRLRAALDDGIEVALGSRAIKSEDVRVSTWFHRKYLGRFFNLLVNVLLVPDIADTQCGFKLFTYRSARFLFTHAKANGFSFDVEILHLAQRAGIPMKEIPINWTNVPGSKVNVIVDGIKMAFDVLLFTLRHRNVSADTYRAFVDQLPAN